MIKLSSACCNLTKQILNKSVSSVIIDAMNESESKIEETKEPEKIVIKMQSNNKEYVHGRSLKNPKWIVVHYTACVNVSAKSLSKSMTNNKEASSHFYIDENDIYPAVPLNYIAWHVGNGRCKQPDPDHPKALKDLAKYNSKSWRYNLAASNHLKWIAKGDDFTGNSVSIGVDICVKKVSNKTKSAVDLDWYFESKAVENTAKVIAYLMQKYDISLDHVIRHGDATGKLCPQPFAWPVDKGDQAWEDFKELISKYRNYEIAVEYV